MSEFATQLPLTAFQKYFDLTLPAYNKLSPTEKGIVLSLVRTYPEKFKYKTVVKEVGRITPVTADTTPTNTTTPANPTMVTRMISFSNTNRSMRKKMMRRINMRKKKGLKGTDK